MMRKRVILGLCTLLLATPVLGAVATATCPALPAAGVPAASPLAGRAIDNLFQQAIASGTSAGYAVAIADDAGRILFARAYGRADLEIPAAVNADSIFRVGSITKQFTAAAMLLLAERGQLSIDDPVSDHISGFPDPHITLRHLLNHSSGLRNYTTGDFPLRDARVKRSMAEMVAYILAQPDLLSFPPGSRFSYSNSGYYLLGAVIEKVSGRPYDQFIQQEMLAPLGLTQTAIDLDEQIVPGLVRGYDPAPGTAPRFTNAMYNSPSVAGPAGALHSTLGDMICWNRALMGGRVLSSASLEAMIRPGLGDYGLGLMTRTSPDGIVAIGHTGSISGFNAALFTLRDKGRTFVILGNSKQSVLPLVQTVQKAVATFF